MKKIHALFAVSVGLVLILFAVVQMYTNYNDGQNVYGRGSLLVKSCMKTDSKYVCSGSFQQHSGMIDVANANVETDRFYYGGQIIDDVFPHYTYHGSEIAGGKFETGATRRSIASNLPYMILGLTGIVLFSSPLIIKKWSLSHK